MNLTDKIRLPGILEYRIRRNGEIIEGFRDNNLVVEVARDWLAHLIAGDAAAKAITKIGFGTNGDEPEDGDTALTDAYVKDLGAHTYPEAGMVKFDWTLSALEANGKSILEFGLICADDSLFSRKHRTGAIVKGSDIDMEGSWTIIF